MPARQAASKSTYRIRNWNQYNDALVRRGSITLWVDQDTLRAWRYQGPDRRGAQFEYSDLAIECLLTRRAVYHLTLRATEGFARSLFELMGVDLPVPDYTTLCRRAATVRITLPKRAEGPLHLVLDSTGLKVYGEGEWKVRQHGYSKRRTWLKLHLAVDPQTHEIQAAMVTDPGVTDAETVPALLGQVENPIERAADGQPWIGDPVKTAAAGHQRLMAALEKAHPVKADGLRMQTATFGIPIDADRLREELDRYRKDSSKCTSGEWVDAGFAKEWFEAASKWKLDAKSLPFSVSTLRLGEVGWLVHPAELFSFYGLTIRHRSPTPHTLLVGYTDGIIGYLPDPSGFKAGIYEAVVVPKILDLPPFRPDAAAEFTARAVDLEPHALRMA